MVETSRRGVPASMKSVELLIFDLDGTLIDSKADIAWSVNAALEKFGRQQLGQELISSYVGFGIRPLFESLVAQDPSFDLEAVHHEFMNLYTHHLADRTRPYPGMVDVLEHFSAKTKVVLTNKSQAFADKIIDILDLRRFFPRVYGRDAFAKRKPDPEPVSEICRVFACVPAKAVIIGDTEVDLLAGKGAGIMTCAALYGYGTRARLELEKPDFTIDCAAELLRLFR
jgi:phosphoglycolate phosphatase